MRVLVAEDNNVMANVIQFNLKQAGFEVVHAPAGDVAWERLQQEKFDLVVTDFQMPNLNGGDLCRRIRQDPSLRTTPVILLTAKSLELGEDYCRGTLGVDAVMMKPFSPRSLVQLARELVQAVPVEENGG